MADRRPAAGLGPRLIAAETLRQVLAGASFAPIGAEAIADPRDRALANRLVTTALRRHGHLSIALDRLLHRGLPQRAGSFEAVLRLALAQLLFLPDLGDHSALFLAGEALKADGKAAHLKGLANAVLRRAQAERASLSALPLADLFPEDLRARWTERYGAAALDRFGHALLDGPALDVTLGADDPELVAALGAVPVIADTVRVGDRDRPVDALAGFAEGRWWVQDVAAAIPARLIGLDPGARVLDLCAAPGGKTAQLIKAGYRVTALDSDAGRLDRLGQNLRRLGQSAEIVLADAAHYRPEEPFDAVLVDAPCTASGIFRRHPEVIWHRGAADIADRARLQRRLVEAALAALKPGGMLVYCVCSLEPEEGEAQAAWMGGPGCGLQPLPIRAAELGGLIEAVTPEGWVRTHPGLALPHAVQGGLDGFFTARFQKPGR